MSQLITTDNNINNKLLISDPHSLEDLKHIADYQLDKLVDKNENDVWLFPKREERYDDLIDKEVLFSLEGNTLTTGNIMGFIGYGDTELTIRSRFSNSDGNDWFMQYMLKKVFAINIFNLQHSHSNESALDIAALLFPYFLQKALCQGLYREYIRKEYNDSRARGALNISAHIKKNYPFKNGKISYSTREYTYDNSVTQLIRHTIEFLKSNDRSCDILFSSTDTKEYIRMITEATPSYRKGDLNKVLLANLKPKIHPYYSEYTPLQKLCLQILKRQKLSYGDSNRRIHGVLFDGAWLWEEYLSLTLTKAGFKHFKNKVRNSSSSPKESISPFLDTRRHGMYPDFMAKNVIADAKYKRLMKPSDNQRRLYDNIKGDDLSQMIAYLHVTSSNKGIFISPSELSVVNPETGEFYPETTFVLRTDEFYVYKVGSLHGGGEILILSINIPKSQKTFSDFAAIMAKTESVLLNSINQIIE